MAVTGTIQSRVPDVESHGSTPEPLRIVLIDDEPILRMTFLHLLHSQGYRAWAANGGEEGVRICLEVLPHLVITDILMPGLDGFGAMRQIRNELPDVLIIAMSAMVGADCTARCEEAGADQCLRKPVDGQTLIAAIRQLIAASK